MEEKTLKAKRNTPYRLKGTKMSNSTLKFMILEAVGGGSQSSPQPLLPTPLGKQSEQNFVGEKSLHLWWLMVKKVGVRVDPIAQLSSYN